jgi:hypothetical protein
MSTNDTTRQEPSAPADTIFVAATGGSNNTYHARRSCMALKNASEGTVQRKQYRNRPLRSTACAFCIGDAR